MARAKPLKLLNQLSNERCPGPAQIEKAIKWMGKGKNEMIAIPLGFFQALLTAPLIRAIRPH